jgi:hypothetical protein
MIVSKISCAGPDNSNSPQEIAQFLFDNPDAEIGIQLSKTRQGEPEYPTHEWIWDLVGELQKTNTRQLCLHVNGEWSRAMAKGTIPPEIGQLIHQGKAVLERIQLNFNAKRDNIRSDDVRKIITLISQPIILQDNDNNHSLVQNLTTNKVPFNVLFDASLGLGISPKTFPEPINGYFCAWAGGMSPENIMDRLEIISSEQNQKIGIDAQKALRVNNIFNVRRAQELVMVCRSFNVSKNEDDTLKLAH